MPATKIDAVAFERHPKGWRCSITFRLTTARQFTDETMVAESAVYRWWLAAWWNARGSMRLLAEVYGAQPGERASRGWRE